MQKHPAVYLRKFCEAVFCI